jgi:A nuclease family of the HNH/ENDO VII superfamily with conserved AHH
MSKEERKKTDAEIFAAPKRNILALTIGINNIAAHAPDTNGYALRNEAILARDKAAICQKNEREMSATAVALQAQSQRRIDADSAAIKNAAVAARTPRKILYKKGVTVIGATAATLAAEASNIELDHSRKLMRNYLVANPGMPRLLETDAHHIVAWLAEAAERARQILFSVGIGINDADNCTILPRFLTTMIPNMPNASAHQHIHTIRYYANVIYDLTSIAVYDQAEVRLALRTIRSQLVAGTFPY